MTNEMTELEHIEMNLVDGVSLDYWRGVEDGLEVACEMIDACKADEQGDPRCALLNLLQRAIAQLRDRRVAWLLRVVPAER